MAKPFQKNSITGTEHVFKISENGNKNTYKLSTGFNIKGVSFSLYKNDKPIIEMPKSKFGFFLFLFMGIVVYRLIFK